MATTRQRCLCRKHKCGRTVDCDEIAKIGSFFFINIGQEQFNVVNSTGKAREGFLLGSSLKDICCDVKTEHVIVIMSIERSSDNSWV